MSTSDVVDNILTHFGTKGMKWGVRRDRSPAAVQRRSAERMNRQDTRFREKSRGNSLNPNYTIMTKINHKVSSAATKSMKPEIKQLNKKPEYNTREAKVQIRKNKKAYHPDPNTYPIAAKYHKEVSDIYMKNIEAMAPRFMQVSPSGRLEHRLKIGKNYWTVEIEEVKSAKHADISNSNVTFKVRPIFDDEGYIVDVEMVEEDLSQSAIDNILAHHGVKGMRWGVRRKATVGAQEVVVSDKRKKIKTSGGQGHPSHSDAVRARTIGQVGKKSGLKALSNKELQDYNQRLNLEQQTKRLSYNDKSPPKKFVLKLLGQTGQQQANEAANAVASKQVKKLLLAAGAA